MIRTIGLVVLLFALHCAVDGIYLGLLKNYPVPHSPYYIYILMSILSLVVSIYLLKGAPHLLRFCYPEEPQPIPRNEV